MNREAALLSLQRTLHLYVRFMHRAILDFRHRNIQYNLCLWYQLVIFVQLGSRPLHDAHVVRHSTALRETYKLIFEHWHEWYDPQADRPSLHLQAKNHVLVMLTEREGGWGRSYRPLKEYRGMYAIRNAKLPIGRIKLRRVGKPA